MTPIIEEYEYESLLKYYNKILIDYTIKLHTTGLESGDYWDIDQIIRKISKRITAYCEDVPIP